MIEKPAHLSAEMSVVWDELAPQVRLGIGGVGLESLCAQVLRMRDAQRRIGEEGLIVADAKGNASPHPAIAIEKVAQAEVRTWMAKFGRR